jgi:pre-rRNA-processing protein TSR1
MSKIYKQDQHQQSQEWRLIQQADEKLQQSLEMEAYFDEMNAEQTWPTEQELEQAQIRKVFKKVPKGTSDYQAAWILESEEEEVFLKNF